MLESLLLKQLFFTEVFCLFALLLLEKSITLFINFIEPGIIFWGIKSAFLHWLFRCGGWQHGGLWKLFGECVCLFSPPLLPSFLLLSPTSHFSPKIRMHVIHWGENSMDPHAGNFPFSQGESNQCCLIKEAHLTPPLKSYIVKLWHPNFCLPQRHNQCFKKSDFNLIGWGFFCALWRHFSRLQTLKTNLFLWVFYFQSVFKIKLQLY